MNIDFLNDPTLSAMGHYMTRLSKRQQVVASNIANIDTPGYKTKEISFHATLGELMSADAIPMRTSQPEHMALGELAFAPTEPDVFEEQGLPARADNNNVDIDKEMLKLGETSFGYSVMTQLLRVKFHTISTSIHEGSAGQ